MNESISKLIFISLFGLISLTIPNWNFDSFGIDLIPYSKEVFSSSSPNVKLTQKIEKSGDTIIFKNILNVNGGSNIEVGFKEIDKVFSNIGDYSIVICPKGAFHPYDGNGNEIKPSKFESLGYTTWKLKCFKHVSNIFLVYYYNKGSKAFYGYPSHNKQWDGGNEYHKGLYWIKIKDTNSNGDYPCLYLADKYGLTLIGAKQTLKDENNNAMNHNDNVIYENICPLKDQTFAYFNDNNDQFYFLTYNKDSFSIGHSNTETISDYLNYDNLHGVDLDVKKDLTLPFIDQVEITEMNFIGQTQYIYYAVKNTANGNIYHGVMDFNTQKVLFNLDNDIISFEPFSDTEMLVVTSTSAYKVCLFQSDSSCVQSCPSGTTFVQNINGNKCLSSEPSSEECLIKLMPDGICIDSCDSEVYIYNSDTKKCGLCNYFDDSKPYRIIGTNICYENRPDNTIYYNEKLFLLQCSKGYQLDKINNECIPHCYSTCQTCEDYSVNQNNQLCITCKEGYKLNGTNCEIIITDAPIITTQKIEEPIITTQKIIEEPIITTQKIIEEPTVQTVKTENVLNEPDISTKNIVNVPATQTEKINIETNAPEVIEENCILEKCKKCNEQSLKYDLCLSCKEELGFYAVNYITFHSEYVDCKKRDDPKLSNFFYNEEFQEYRPCYKTCKKCLIGGNEEAHNCLECESGYMFRPGTNPNNNCVVYSEYYYFVSAYNQYKSMDILQCPEEAKYLVKEKKYCIDDCKQDTKYKYLYSGNCLETCPEGTSNVNFVCKEDPNRAYLQINEFSLMQREPNMKIANIFAKTYASEFDYTENHASLHQNKEMDILLYKNKDVIDELPIEIPKVDFKDCLSKVKQKYNIEENVLISVIEKKDNNNHQTSYAFYHPQSGEKLIADDVCLNETIVITENLTSLLNKSSPNFKLQMSLTEQGINIFDLNDPFYKDICYDFDNPNKRDIALRDRVREAYPNATLCEEGCRNSGINLGDMQATCDCTFHDIMQSNVVKENEILDSMIGQVFDIIDDSNILVVKCYKYIIKYFKRSYGGIITSILIILNLIFTIVFFLFQFRKIAKYIYSITNKYLKLIHINSKKNIEENPPKRNAKLEKIKTKEEKKIIKIGTKRKILNEKQKIKRNIKQSKKGEKLNINQVTTYHETSDEAISEGSDLNNYFKEYLSASPDEMEFDDAIKKDDRSFCQYFAENLKEKQIIANTFIASDPIKIRIIKLILFNLNLILYIVVNGLFFSEVYISKLYNINEDEENFFSFLPRSIDRLIYSTLVSIIIQYLVECFFVEEIKIKGIFKRNLMNKEYIKQEIIELINEIKKRYISFIILVFILLLASLYYLLCFNYVYPKSQIEWIKSSIAIIIVIQILSVLKIFLGAILRFLSFGCNSEYIFKFSKLFN